MFDLDIVAGQGSEAIGLIAIGNDFNLHSSKSLTQTASTHLCSFGASTTVIHSLTTAIVKPESFSSNRSLLTVAPVSFGTRPTDISASLGIGRTTSIYPNSASVLPAQPAILCFFLLVLHFTNVYR